MDIAWKTGIWQQFGAAIDMLDSVLRACPDELWCEQLWDNEPATFSQYWYQVYHALFWLDLYLFGAEEGFIPPAPFTLIEQDDDGPLPEKPYTKAQLQAYLDDCRQKCQTTIAALTDEAARRRCQFAWGEVSFAELLLYNMRHVQGHAAQLDLMLGQKGTSTSDWIAQARSDIGRL
ncbi:MAG: DinB family protein [Chloroflexota bacterium]